jgi:hypothetical protein
MTIPGRAPASGRQPLRRDILPVLGVGLALLGLLWLATGYLSFPSADGWGYDVRAYADAAERLIETGTLYQAETLGGPYRPGPYGLYMYAPPLGVAFTPVVGMDADLGIRLWFIVHVVALAFACALMPVRISLRLAGFGVAALSLAATRDLVLGNVSVLLLLPLSVAWRWLDRPLGQIALAFAISVRPTLGILLIWQLLRRRWRAVAWTLGAGLALVFLTLPFVGVRGYLDYVTVLRNMTDVSGVTYNHDLGSVALELGAGSPAVTVALLAGYVVGIGAMLLSLRRDRETGFMVTLMASLLLAPLLWDHYLAMLLLPAAFLAGRGHPWALLLPLASWLPVVVGSWTWLYPLIVILATLLPFLARDPAPAAPTAPGPAVVTT